MAEVESACCQIVELTDGVDPHQTWQEYYEGLNLAEYAVIEEDPPADWQEPVWKVKVNHFLTYCERKKALDTILANRAQ